MTRVVEMYRSLPRAGRWAALALAGLVAYFAAVEPAVDLTMSLSARADARADAIAEVRSGPKGEDAVTLGLRRFGRVEGPGDPRERGVAFNRRVLEVLEKHGVRNHTSTMRTAPLGRGPLLTALEPAGQRVDRLIREVKFEGPPETVAAVVADLERSPEVASVPRVQVRKAGTGRSVQATVDAEAWVLTQRSAAR